jgi:hypothetical protein
MITTAPVLGFIDQAKTQNWDTVCDPSLTFEAPVLIELLAVWRGHAGERGIASRKDLNARILKNCLGNLMIFERITPGKYRVRLMGTRLSGVLGELQGQILDEALPSEIGSRWQLGIDATLNSHQPLRFVSRVTYKRFDFLQAEVLLAPLLGDCGEPSMAIAGVVFNAGISSTSRLNDIVNGAG